MTKVEISGTGKGLSPDGDAGWCLRVCLDLLDGVTARHGMDYGEDSALSLLTVSLVSVRWSHGSTGGLHAGWSPVRTV